MNHYMTNFTLMYDLKKPISEWDNMMPFERQIYLDLIINRMKEENKGRERTSSIPTEAEYRGTYGKDRS